MRQRRSIPIRILPISRDLRSREQQRAGAELLQRLADIRIERLWRARVAANANRRLTRSARPF